MKKLATLLCAFGLACGASAQGLVQYLNNPSTLVTLNSNGVPLGNTPAVAGRYYFGLFIAPSGTLNPNAFTFTGMLATNQAVAGRFFGGTGKPVPGWPAGESRAIFVAGWSASLGTDWNTIYGMLDGNFYPNWSFNIPGFFGISAITTSTGPAGGFDGVGTLPNLNLFGGLSGIQSGFTLMFNIPEPSTFALAGVGVALWIFRRRRTDTFPWK